MKVTDEMLMALADGELDREMALDVRRSAEADPALAVRLAEFERTRRLAKQAFDGVLEEPVPLRLVAAMGRGVPRQKQAARRVWLPIGAAIAASAAAFALGMVLTSGLQRGPGPLDEKELASLLQTVPSGETRSVGAESFEATGSFAVPDGVCRGFLLSGASRSGSAWHGVGCQHDGRWELEILVAGRAADGESYSPASDRAAESIGAFLDALGAGAPLGADAERRLMESGWQSGAEGPRE
jgi:anti-sigma factor RsiW